MARCILRPSPVAHAWHFETEETKSARSWETMRPDIARFNYALLFSLTFSRRQWCCRYVDITRYCAHVRMAYLMAYNYRHWKTHPTRRSVSFFRGFMESTFLALATARDVINPRHISRWRWGWTFMRKFAYFLIMPWRIESRIYLRDVKTRRNADPRTVPICVSCFRFVYFLRFHCGHTTILSQHGENYQNFNYFLNPLKCNLIVKSGNCNLEKKWLESF